MTATAGAAMATGEEAALGVALRAERDRYNARFALARLAAPRLDGEEFGEVLRQLIAPIVERAATSGSAVLVDALYGLALELLAADLVGPRARRPELALLWRELAVALAPQIARAPRRLAASLWNALDQLPAGTTATWQATLLRVAPLAGDDVELLLAAGQVVAWRAGLAHLRQGALTVAGALPPAIARTALGLGCDDGAVAAAIARLAADPWLAPERAAMGARTGTDGALRVVARAGAFRGFGGLFHRPPTVAAIGDQLVAEDGHGRWLIAADACGATFHRVAEAAPVPTPVTPFTLDGSGTARRTADGATATFADLALATSAASTSTTLAVTLPRSHVIHLIGWVDGGG